jgi:hypothetical protein
VAVPEIVGAVEFTGAYCAAAAETDDAEPIVANAATAAATKARATAARPRMRRFVRERDCMSTSS